jgi:hypothetical protein
MDSTLPKDSNGTSFVIFGCRDQKIWIIEVLDGIWFEKLIRNSVSTEGCHVV